MTEYLIVLLTMLLVAAVLSYIHYKRTGNRYSDSFRWFTKLLR